MLPYYRYTRAEISLDALRHNLAEFRRVLPASVKLMAVVKANAYGHGMVEIAEEAVAVGVDYLAVAFLDEALELRRSGAAGAVPILVLGYTPPEGATAAAKAAIELTAFEAGWVERAGALLSEAAELPPLKLHLKLDTGMGRLGATEPAQAVAFAEAVTGTSGMTLEGLYTHYACADEEDKSYTFRQYERFAMMQGELARHGYEPPVVHLGNSAAGIDMPELTGGMLRLGISLYGLYPSDEVNGEKVALQPVMSLKTALVQVKRATPGTGISYGATYVTAEEEWIGTLPVGYADGFTRLLTGKASALVGGVRVPVVGRICMDQCMVRLQEDAPASVGDEVVLLGEQAGERITADEWAGLLGTINYEIPCMIAHRVPRVYVRGGAVVKVQNPYG